MGVGGRPACSCGWGRGRRAGAAGSLQLGHRPALITFHMHSRRRWRPAPASPTQYRGACSLRVAGRRGGAPALARAPLAHRQRAHAPAAGAVWGEPCASEGGSRLWCGRARTARSTTRAWASVTARGRHRETRNAAAMRGTGPRARYGRVPQASSLGRAGINLLGRTPRLQSLWSRWRL